MNEQSAPNGLTGSTPQRRAQIAQLTGIRAFAAFWVLSFHFRPEIVQAWPKLSVLAPVMNVGHLGVDLFFILSGFILAITHLDKMTSPTWTVRGALGFIWLRISRVWPLTAFSLVVWALYLAARAMLGSSEAAGGLVPGRLLEHLMLIQAWGTAHHDWNPIDWSVSAEWLAYLSFAVGVSLFAGLKAHTRARTRALLSVILLVPIVAVGVSLQDGSDLLWNGDQIIPGIVALRVLSEFSAGVLLATVSMSLGRQRRPWIPIPTLTVVAVLAVLFFLGYHDPRPNFRFGADWLVNGTRLWGPSESAVIIPLLAMLIISLALFPGDPFSRLLSMRPLVWLGKVSFAVYLIHWLFLDIMRRSVGVLGVPQAANLVYQVLTGAAILSSVVAGWLMWRFVEEPSRRTLRALLPESIRV